MNCAMFRQDQPTAASRVRRLSTRCPAAAGRGGGPAPATCLPLPQAREQVIDLARNETEGRFCVFEGDWDRVDALRERARRAGVDDRVTVRHAAALDITRFAYALAG